MYNFGRNSLILEAKTFVIILYSEINKEMGHQFVKYFFSLPFHSKTITPQRMVKVNFFFSKANVLVFSHLT